MRSTANPKLLSCIMAKPKRPRDMNQLAVHVGKIATGEIEDVPAPPADENAVKRGKARAAALSPRKRRAIAKKGAEARWKKEGR